MISKIKIAGLMMALIALTIPTVWAENSALAGSSHQEADWHQAREAQMMAQVLNLSEDQVKQLKDIKQKQKDAKRSISEQMKADKEAFENEIVKASPDMTKINDLKAQIKTVQSQMLDIHLNTILDIKKLLTPEQFAGYMALEKEEDLKKHEGFEKFGRRDGFEKDGHGHEHWNKADEGDKD